MYSFRKSKKGFTLIELMVVVAIIGVLALLGLRLYTGQQAKAKNAIVKANAGTIQTLIQAELADTAADDIDDSAVNTLINSANIYNPWGGQQTSNDGTLASAGSTQGLVHVTKSDTVFSINGTGASGDVYENDLTAQP